VKMPHIGYYELPESLGKSSPVVCFDAFGWEVNFSVLWRFVWPESCVAALTIAAWSADHQHRRFALFGWGWSKCDVPRVPLFPVAGWMPERLDGFRVGWLGFFVQVGPK